MIATGVIEGLARRERAGVLIALAIVIVVSAFLMLRSGDALMMPGHAATTQVALLFLMWWTMMLAMMLPSAAPAILTFGAVSRRIDGNSAAAHMFAFSAGYIVVWTGFSVAAVALQLTIDPILRLNPMYATTSRVMGGILLIIAGAYQLTPLKETCLRKCQMPLMVFARNWRPGINGALRMGLSHGLYCVGCCAVLMAVLFYGGVMEPAWVAGLAAYVLVEKVMPRQWYLSRFSGILLCAWGAAVLWKALG